MHRILGAVAVTLLVSALPAFAADQNAGQSPAGGDTSTGAKEQSSAPPGSDAAGDTANKSSEGASGGDTSTGAKEQSSAPPGSSAATGQPNASSGGASSTDGMKSSNP
jgi:hypothetical protein